MRGVVVALGNFDGVHLGHQRVLGRAVEVGKEQADKVIAATFNPHPRAVLRPGTEPKLLTTLELRKEALIRYGADDVYVIRFDKELSNKSPEKFVVDVLVGDLGAATVVVGENFRFGHKASGNVEDLRRIMEGHGGLVYAVPIREANGEEEVNSTRIRELISMGEVSHAAKLLGRPYLLRGAVVVGDMRGRTIGFPTANVASDPAALIPASGVYAGTVWVGDKEYAACTNVGVAPTFERGESRVEAYLLDFEGDLYRKTVDVSFTDRIRGERKFSGIEELKQRITRDVEEARRIAGDKV
ncbi:MAG: bifunctional riboflavin kinase/FAD synthetase [Rubrobacteraceae bacterium]